MVDYCNVKLYFANKTSYLLQNGFAQLPLDLQTSNINSNAVTYVFISLVTYVTYVFIYVCIYTYVFMYLCICMYLCIIRMYLCIYVCICYVCIYFTSTVFNSFKYLTITYIERLETYESK